MNRRWTAHEDALIRRDWPRGVAAKLICEGRSANSVATRAKQIGLDLRRKANHARQVKVYLSDAVADIAAARAAAAGVSLSCWVRGIVEGETGR